MINNEVIYQIYPLTFNYAPGSKSDPYKGCYGNLKGVTQMAPYVSSLGVDAIWITPFYPWGGNGFGYDIVDYYGIDSMFGTVEDLKELCDVYHSYNIRVIIDQVYNHCSIHHPWFEKSVAGIKPFDEFFVWAPAKCFDANNKPVEPNNWPSVWNSNGPSAWQWNEERKMFSLHSFDHTMPDLNINNIHVQNMLLDVAKYWFDLGVDGFSLDAANQYGCDPLLKDNPIFTSGKNKGKQERKYDINSKGGEIFINRLKDLCNSYEKPKTLLAEYWYNISRSARKDMIKLFEDSNCDAFFLGTLNYTLKELKPFISRDLSVVPNGVKINWANSNHDLERVASRVFGDKVTLNKNIMLMHFLLSLPGSICIYQGQELGLSNPKDFEHCKNAKFDPLNIWKNFNMPWDASRAGFALTDSMDDVTRTMALMPDEEQYKLAVSNQNFEGSMLNKTREMIFKRKNSFLSQYGHVAFIKGIKNDGVIAFVRSDINKTHKVLHAYNFSDTEYSFIYRNKSYTLAPETMIAEVL
jgi:alpha-glucosidase